MILMSIILVTRGAAASDLEFITMERSFKNFITCELTRTNATNYFKGKSFEITMIDMFTAQPESGMTILTGSVECFVDNTHKNLYAAVGLKTVMGSRQVLYLTIRHKDFSILATELIRYPYKERCKWAPYWIDTD